MHTAQAPSRDACIACRAWPSRATASCRSRGPARSTTWRPRRAPGPHPGAHALDFSRLSVRALAEHSVPATDWRCFALQQPRPACASTSATTAHTRASAGLARCPRLTMRSTCARWCGCRWRASGQVLANPATDIQEGEAVSRADLQGRGIRPYDEKVSPRTMRDTRLRQQSSTAIPSAAGMLKVTSLSGHAHGYLSLTGMLQLRDRDEHEPACPRQSKEHDPSTCRRIKRWRPAG